MNMEQIGRTVLACLAGAIFGGVTGCLGGAVGGWVSGYLDPLANIAGFPPSTLLELAWTGADTGWRVGVLVGAISGAVYALIGGLISMVTCMMLAGGVFWILAGITPESILGFPGAPVGGAVLGVAGGYLARRLIVKPLPTAKSKKPWLSSLVVAALFLIAVISLGLFSTPGSLTGSLHEEPGPSASEISDLLDPEKIKAMSMAEYESAVAAEPDINVRTKDGYTPLHFAAVRGTPDHISVLIEAGADVNAAANDGGTPLFWAVMNLSPDATVTLISAGANVNVSDIIGHTPLHRAAWMGHPPTIDALVAAGARVEVHDEEGLTPLHIAAARGWEGNVGALIRAGADVNARSNDGSTPLHLGASDSNQADIRALIKAGADPNALNDLGLSPLHYAAAMSIHPENVTALLEAGAVANLRNVDGDTPFDLAEENPNIQGTPALQALKDAMGE